MPFCPTGKIMNGLFDNVPTFKQDMVSEHDWTEARNLTTGIVSDNAMKSFLEKFNFLFPLLSLLVH